MKSLAFILGWKFPFDLEHKGQVTDTLFTVLYSVG